MITNAGIKHMGFRQSQNPIHAKFYSFDVYEIKGISKDCEAITESLNKKYSDDNITYAIGININDICSNLLGINFVFNEAEHTKQKNIQPPYLVILTTTPDEQICKSGCMSQTKNNHILTYDCFSETKNNLLQSRKDNSLSFLLALSSQLLDEDHHLVVFNNIDYKLVGISTNNKIVEDINITTSLEVNVSKIYSLPKIENSIKNSSLIYNQIQSKVSYFFNIAMQEKDSLKKFIYLFLTLEVCINKAFKTLKIDCTQIPDNIKKNYPSLLEKPQNLMHKFIFCVYLSWNKSLENNIDTFRKLKQTRDKIYHGEIVNMENLPIIEAHRLILKIIKVSLKP
jgi:hypothetical protein